MSKATDVKPTSSLFDQISDEIWLMIFRLCIRSTSLSYQRDAKLPNDKKVSIVNPFRLGLLCRSWRRVTISNPSLWENIYFVFSTIKGTDESPTAVAASTSRFQAEFDAFRLWVTRAGNRPLSMSFMVASGCFDLISNVAMQLPNLVVQHASQFTKLDIPVCSEWYPLFQGSKYPLLHELEIHVPDVPYLEDIDDFDRTPVSEVDLDFSNAPLLRKFGMDAGFDHAVIDLPWSGISDLSLSWITPADCFDTIFSLPNLRHCTLSISPLLDPESEEFEDDPRPDDLKVDKSGRMEEPALESLSLDFTTPDLTGKILELIPLTLKSLKIHSELAFGDPEYLLDTIPAFADTLEELKITLDLDYRKLLPPLRNLSTLELVAFEDFDLSIFATPSILSKLENIRISGLPVPDATLLDVLQFRTQATECVKLKRFCLSTEDRGVPDLLPETKVALRKMIEGGTDIVISHWKGRVSALSSPNVISVVLS